MKLYVLYDQVQDRLIADMKSYASNKKVTLGAVKPVDDANYFNSIVVAGALSDDQGRGIRPWWKWAVKALNETSILMSDEFGFDPANVVVEEMDVHAAVTMTTRR